MRSILKAAVIVTGALAAGQVYAQTCPAGSERINGGNDLLNFLSGKMVCATRGGERWQEHHQGSGALVDYKLGPGHAVDPTTNVGTWAASNGTNAAVTYTYTGAGAAFTFIVCAVPTRAAAGSYTFVGSSTITGATIFASATPAACP